MTEITDANPLYQPGGKVDMVAHQQAVAAKLAEQHDSRALNDAADGEASDTPSPLLSKGNRRRV